MPHYKDEVYCVIKAENRAIVNGLQPINMRTVMESIRDHRYVDAEIRQLEEELGEEVEAHIVNPISRRPVENRTSP